MGRIYVRQLARREPLRRFRRDFTDVQTFADHAQFYTRHPRCYRRLRHLVCGHPLAELDWLDESLDADKCAPSEIVRTMEESGLTPFWRELTTPDVGASGLRVVRVLVPEMQPLHANHQLPFLGGTRHLHPESVFRWVEKTNRRHVQNRFPHPYP